MRSRWGRTLSYEYKLNCNINSRDVDMTNLRKYDKKAPVQKLTHRTTQEHVEHQDATGF